MQPAQRCHIVVHLTTTLSRRRDGACGPSGRGPWLAGRAYFGLFISLLVGYAVANSHGQWAFGPPIVQLAVSCFVLTIPLFFAGIIFSSLIGDTRINISTAFAYNLMGALFGGVMEYNSMYFGFAFLYLLAMGFYSLAWLFSRKSVSLNPVRALSPAE